ncbi:MAG: hypothetical protein JO330_02360 [Mycobacteriaceae bacterium]|nr:hypothetical protein [Mycobacteriaceae bacterium]
MAAVEPVNRVGPAEAVAGVWVELLRVVMGGVELLRVVMGEVEPEEAFGLVAAVRVVAPVSLGLVELEVALLGDPLVVAVEAGFCELGLEPVEPVLVLEEPVAVAVPVPVAPVVVALDPALLPVLELEPPAEPVELVVWLLPPVGEVDPPECAAVSAWACPKPLANAAPTPSVTAPAPSQVDA